MEGGLNPAYGLLAAAVPAVFVADYIIKEMELPNPTKLGAHRAVPVCVRRAGRVLLRVRMCETHTHGGGHLGPEPAELSPLGG